MKTKYVQDLEPNEKNVVSFFLVQSKEVRFKKTSGEPFLSLVLSDRSGQIEAKMWDGVEAIADTFDRDDFVKVKAHIQLYRERPQMIVQKLRRAQESEIDLDDYVPHTRRNIDEMFAELREAVQGFQNPHLKALILAFLDDEEIAASLRVAPAAKSLHHAVVGGLLEHICSLMRLAKLVASNYDYINLDLLQTGVVLHDIAKISELTYDRSFGYSDEGQLLGHITISLQWIDRKCAQIPDFPPKLKRLVEHMVLSHHGKYEFGSPKLPMFPEALALHYIDDLDSKLESMRAALDAELGGSAPWSRYNPALERPVLNVQAFLRPDAADAEAPPTPPASRAEPDDWQPAPPSPPLPATPQLPLSSPTPASDGPAPRNPKSAPAAPGLFGEKLRLALDSEKPAPGPDSAEP